MPSIEIQTTQNVTIEYELASLRDRFFAFFLDLLIFYVVYIILWITLTTVLGNFMTEWGLHFLALLNLVGFMAFQLLFEMVYNGQTLGKRMLNLKVVRLDGQEPGPGDYFLRSLFLLIDFFFSLGVLAALLIGSTFRSQRLGDLAANTAVIRAKSQMTFHLNDILNIQSLENYEPRYPAVRQLSEADVLLIKNLLTRFQVWQNQAHTQAVSEAVQRICSELNIEPPPTGNKVDFLKILIRDYIILTR